jgi:hypothetical protein
MGVVEHEEMEGFDPLPVARVVARVAGNAAPGLRYTVGPAFERLVPVLKGLLPYGVYEALMRRHYRLP